MLIIYQNSCVLRRVRNGNNFGGNGSRVHAYVDSEILVPTMSHVILYRAPNTQRASR